MLRSGRNTTVSIAFKVNARLPRAAMQLDPTDEETVAPLNLVTALSSKAAVPCRSAFKRAPRYREVRADGTPATTADAATDTDERHPRRAPRPCSRRAR